MSELSKRVTFAVIAAPLAVYLVYVGGAPLAILLSLASGIAAREFYRMVSGTGSDPLTGHGVLLSAAIPLLAHANVLGWWTPSLTVLMLVFLELLTVALFTRGSAGKPMETIGSTLLGIVYTGGALSFAYALRYHPYAIGAASGAALVSTLGPNDTELRAQAEAMGLSVRVIPAPSLGFDLDRPEDLEACASSDAVGQTAALLRQFLSAGEAP